MALTALSSTGDWLLTDIVAGDKIFAVNELARYNAMVTWANTVIAQCVIKDGTIAMAADLDMGENKVVGVVDPTSNQEAATKKYVDDKVSAATAGTGHVNASSDVVYNGSVGTANTFEDLDISGTVGSNISLVHVRIATTTQCHVFLKPKGDAATVSELKNTYGCPPGNVYLEGVDVAFTTIVTASDGKCEIACNYTNATLTVTVLAFII